jgi:hypothetical protein
MDVEIERMNIDDTARREALLRILNGWYLQHGMEITRTQLDTPWLRTGLRHSDLRMAIDDLCQSGGLTSLGEARYHLQPRSIELLSLPPDSVQELSALVVAHAELYQAQQRRRSAHAGHDRRGSDRSMTLNA